MSNLDDIYAALGIPQTNDPIADAIAAVAHDDIREKQRAAAAALAEKEHGDRLAALQARADRHAARAKQDADAREYDERRSAARRMGNELPEERYRSAWADWFTGNGRGHGQPEPKIEDFQ